MSYADEVIDKQLKKIMMKSVLSECQRISRFTLYCNS